MAFINDRNSHPWRTVDKEREIYLVRTGGGLPEMPDSVFDLHLKEGKVNFFADKDYKKNDNGIIDVNYHITNLKLPNNLVITLEEVFLIIEEALKEWGLSCDVDITTNVKVNFENKTIGR